MDEGGPKIYILLGRSGCGKGTQAKLLAEKFGYDIIGSGDLLRERVKLNDPVGNKIKNIMDRGELVPSSFMVHLWTDRLEDLKKKNGQLKGIILDGFPRKVLEAEILDETLGLYDWNNIKAFLVDISREEAVNRLTKRRICKTCEKTFPYIGKYKDLERCDKCGGELQTRADDSVAGINERLDYFEEDVVPVIGYYEKKGILTRINGEQDIEKVFEEILSKI